MTRISAGQAVVDVLKAEGVKFVFGMPGGHTIGIYDALYGQQEISHVLVRHEQHAASMAAGYAQLTGEPGVCCVTAGPGATNLVTSIAEAFVGALPIRSEERRVGKECRSLCDWSSDVCSSDLCATDR